MQQGKRWKITFNVSGMTDEQRDAFLAKLRDPEWQATQGKALIHQLFEPVSPKTDMPNYNITFPTMDERWVESS